VDAVDKMIKEWAERRPELDASPLEVVGRLLLCARRLEQALVDALKQLGLSYGDFDVINTLRRVGGHTNPRELSRSALITSGAMTARLDRLVSAGLVERAPDPSDRRGVLVSLTDGGTRLADRALTAVLDADETFLRPLGTADRAAAAALLKRLLTSPEACD
jgi:DNA-binding MarR family transcriptional regulator